MDEPTLFSISDAQRNEITEHIIYSKLAEKIEDKNNKKILKQISDDELTHYKFWKSITKKEAKPKIFFIYWYVFISRLFGLSFGLKLMEKGEGSSINFYDKLRDKVKGLDSMIKDEHKHEKLLLNLLSEERFEYASSIVLGLNDALVELTGALAGLTLALQNGKIIAVIGLITGIAASMSMAASGYLSSKEEAISKSPKKSALYTGIAYVITVILLVFPYIVFKNVYFALILTLVISILIIAGYTFYITTAKSQKFSKRFAEMAIISLTVAVISFIIGYLLRKFISV